MKNLTILFSLIAVCFFTFSCEDPLNTSSNSDIAKQLEGQWKCDETSTLFKSTPEFKSTKSVERIYYVDIYLSGNDSTRVSIDNFYELGSGATARATIRGNTITLINEDLGGDFSVRGSGTISSNFQTITWLYYVDDGSGEEDEVSATYTYIY